MQRGATRPWLDAAFALGALFTALPIWTVDLLPLVDLPQHEALVSALTHWDDPDCGYSRIYEIHGFSPYWLAYLLAWGLSGIAGVGVAFKLLLTATLVAIPLATRRLLAATGGDEAWALVCFPFLFGGPTSWGFVSFLIAVPLVLAWLPAAMRQARFPGFGRGWMVGLGCALLFLAHVLAELYAMTLFAALVAASARSPREWLRGLWPLLLGIPMPALWWWITSRTAAEAQSKSHYLLGWDRITELPAQLTGIPHGGLGLAALALALASLGYAGARFSRDRIRWAPFGATLALVLLAPNMAFGTAYLAPRFTIFLLPLALVALDRAPASGHPARRAVLVFVVTIVLLLGVEARFLGMEAEGRGLAAVLERAPAGERLLYLSYDRGSRYSSEPVFLHSGMRYAVDRCGVAEKSFAVHFQLPVRYRSEAVPPLPSRVAYIPQQFKWEKHGGESYDLFLVRSRGEPDPARFAGAPGRLVLREHVGRWWLFERAPPPGGG